MEKRIADDDGRLIRVRVDDDAVVDVDDARPPIDSDPDELDEGATEALVLVDPKPSTMTVEGAIAAVGVTARYLAGHESAHAPMSRGWWHDWGKYVLLLLALVSLAFGARFFP